MAVLKSPLFRGAKGKFAGNTLLQRGGQTIIRQGNSENTNPRTALQMQRRVRLANLVTMYRAGQSWMPKAFQGKRPAWSDFNAFVSANLNSSPVALTKEQAASGACVCAPYLITKGNLFSVAITRNGAEYNTNIQCNTETPMEEKTVAALAAELVEQNSFLNFGDQISFVSYQQVVNDTTGFPQVLCTSYEITLDPNSTDMVRDYMPEFCFMLNESAGKSVIGAGDSIASGGFAYIISRRTRRGIEVSTQRLFMADVSILSIYSTQEQLQLAVNSYGLGENVFLDPETGELSQNPGAVLALLGFSSSVNSTSQLTGTELQYSAGSISPIMQTVTAGGSSGNILPLHFNNEIALASVKLYLYNTQGTTTAITASALYNPSSSTSTTSRLWGALLPGLSDSTYAQYRVSEVEAIATDGNVYRAVFTRYNKPVIS